MPTFLQASMSRVPAGAVTFLPSTVMFTSAISKSSLVVRRQSFAKPLVPAVLANDQRPFLKPLPERAHPPPPFRTDTACLPNDLQIPCGISSRWKSSASPLHRRADRRCVPACFPRGTECCRYPSSPHHRRETESGSSLTSPCPRGKECTSRKSRADKTS